MGGFARTGGMLNQVALAGTVFQHIGNQFMGGVQLVVAGKNEAGELLFTVALADRVAVKDFQPALTLPDLFP